LIAPASKKQRAEGNKTGFLTVALAAGKDEEVADLPNTSPSRRQSNNELAQWSVTGPLIALCGIVALSLNAIVSAIDYFTTSSDDFRGLGRWQEMQLLAYRFATIEVLAIVAVLVVVGVVTTTTKPVWLYLLASAYATGALILAIAAFIGTWQVNNNYSLAGNSSGRATFAIDAILAVVLLGCFAKATQHTNDGISDQSWPTA
jgi:hypothetical protein